MSTTKDKLKKQRRRLDHQISEMAIFYENKKMINPLPLHFDQLKQNLMQTNLILPLLYTHNPNETSFVPFFNERTTTGKLIKTNQCHSRIQTKINFQSELEYSALSTLSHFSTKKSSNFNSHSNLKIMLGVSQQQEQQQNRKKETSEKSAYSNFFYNRKIRLFKTPSKITDSAPERFSLGSIQKKISFPDFKKQNPQDSKEKFLLQSNNFYNKLKKNYENITSLNLQKHKYSERYQEYCYYVRMFEQIRQIQKSVIGNYTKRERKSAFFVRNDQKVNIMIILLIDRQFIEQFYHLV